MMRYLYFLVVAFLFVLSSHAQTPSTQTASDIFLGMKKLKVFGSVLYIAAHPDDENTRLLTYLSNERLYRTAYLSLTRGEGGTKSDRKGTRSGIRIDQNAGTPGRQTNRWSRAIFYGCN